MFQSCKWMRVDWDHIGGYRFFPDFYTRKDKLNWFNGEFPLSLQQIKEMVIDRCDIPTGFDVNTYEVFQDTPTRILDDGDTIDIRGRIIKVLHTP